MNGRVVLACLLVAVIFVPPGSTAGETTPFPSSIAALGDSLTLAFATIGGEENSWATGANPKVRSQYLRILAANPRVEGHALNLAESGASLEAMRGQARRAVAKHADYVTVWGGEDACGGTTDVASFERVADGILSALAVGKPRPRVFIASILDPARTYRLFQAHRQAVFRANRGGAAVCGLRLGPTAAQDASAETVAEASASARALNDAWSRACAHYGSRCRFDGNAVFGMKLAFSDYSTDFVHLSVSGQRKLAAVTWRATFPFGS